MFYVRSKRKLEPPDLHDKYVTAHIIKKSNPLQYWKVKWKISKANFKKIIMKLNTQNQTETHHMVIFQGNIKYYKQYNSVFF